MFHSRRASGLLVIDHGHPVIPDVRRLLLRGRPSDYGRELLGIAWPPIAGGSGFSQYAESHIIDHANGKTAWTEPAGSYLCLCTTVPTSTSTGSTIVEASYTGYGRQSLSGNWTAATAATPSVGVNTSTVTFAACTGGSSTIVGFALCDASSSGNMIWWGSLTSTVVSTTATPATVAGGALSVSLT